MEERLYKEKDIEKRLINKPNGTIRRYVIYTPNGAERLLNHHQDAVEAIERSNGYYSATKPQVQQNKKRKKLQ